jgi:glutamine synthetase
VSKDDVFQPWLKKRNIEDVEAFVPDMAGSARGKVVPAEKFGSGPMKMPEAIFSQTISGDYIADPNNVEDRDMILAPDPSTLRPVPWATDPAASVFLDCYRRDGTPVSTSPRGVLRSVLGKYEARGWLPVVAPEVEFYLLSAHSDPHAEAEPPEGRLGWTEGAKQPYSIDTMNDFDPFINDLYRYCESYRYVIAGDGAGPVRDQFPARQCDRACGPGISVQTHGSRGCDRTRNACDVPGQAHGKGSGQRTAYSPERDGRRRQQRVFDRRR